MLSEVAPLTQHTIYQFGIRLFAVTTWGIILLNLTYQLNKIVVLSSDYCRKLLEF